MPAHRVEAIANEFITRARTEGRALSNMQLQKLPYIAHGWCLALLDHELLCDNPLTYPYGPVYPSLYKALRKYGSGEVSEPIRENDGTPAAIFNGQRGDVVTADLSDNETKLLNAVWGAYKKYSAFQLSELTHKPDSPWTLTTSRNGPYSVISNEVIKQHFDEIVRQRRSAN